MYALCVHICMYVCVDVWREGGKYKATVTRTHTCTHAHTSAVKLADCEAEVVSSIAVPQPHPTALST